MDKGFQTDIVTNSQYLSSSQTIRRREPLVTSKVNASGLTPNSALGSEVNHTKIPEDILPTWQNVRRWQSHADKAASRSSFLRRISANQTLPDWAFGMAPIPGISNLDKKAVEDVKLLLKKTATTTLTSMADILDSYKNRCTIQANAHTTTLEALYQDNAPGLDQSVRQLQDVLFKEHEKIRVTLTDREQLFKDHPVNMDTLASKLMGLRNHTNMRPPAQARTQAQAFQRRRARSPNQGPPSRQRSGAKYSRSPRTSRSPPRPKSR
jgi:hypothetical protein